MAQKTNILIEQGTDFELVVSVQTDDGDAINLTGYTAQSEMRRYYTSNTSYDFTCTVSDALAGEVTLSMNSATTSALTPRRYVYDMLLIDSSNTVTRFLEGIATVTPGVTR